MTINLTSNATSWDGDWESGELDDWYLPLYDPTAPVFKTRHIVELIVICIAYGIAGKNLKPLTTSNGEYWFIEY